MFNLKYGFIRLSIKTEREVSRRLRGVKLIRSMLVDLDTEFVQRMLVLEVILPESCGSMAAT